MTSVIQFSLLVLAATWIAYPVCIAALAAVRRTRGRSTTSSHVGVSVVVASAESATALRTRIVDLLAADQAPDPFQIVIAVDYANAATINELGHLDPRVVVVLGDSPGGKAATLNAGVRAARQDVLVFADTAQRFAPNAIRELVSALTDTRLGAVSGFLELTGRAGIGTPSDLYWRFERWLRAAEARVYSGVGVTGAIYAMRRDLWRPLPPGLILDDVYTPMRLAMEGWRIGFTASAKAFDARRFTPAQEYRRKVRTLTGVIQLCAWLPRVLNPFRNPVWTQFVFHKLLRLFTPHLALLALVAIAWESAAHAIESGRLSVVYVALAAIVLAILVPRLRRAFCAQVAWAWALQTSALTASIHGLRGNWDVWKK